MKNRHILEVARAMMNEKYMPKLYWAEGAWATLYLMNRCTPSDVHEVNPHEKIYYGRKPNLSSLKVFGSITFMHIPSKKRQKWQSEIGKMHSHGLLTWAKGVQVLQPFNLKGSCESWCCLWRIIIMVWTGFISVWTNWGRVVHQLRGQH